MSKRKKFPLNAYREILDIFPPGEERRTLALMLAARILEQTLAPEPKDSHQPCEKPLVNER